MSDDSASGDASVSANAGVVVCGVVEGDYGLVVRIAIGEGVGEFVHTKDVDGNTGELVWLGGDGTNGLSLVNVPFGETPYGISLLCFGMSVNAVVPL